jgi:hypothetical protein
VVTIVLFEIGLYGPSVKVKGLLVESFNCRALKLEQRLSHNVVF